MPFTVSIKENGLVDVRLPRVPEGTEYLRLDMSDGSVAFLPVARDMKSKLRFLLKDSLLPEQLWVTMRTRAEQVISNAAKRHSPDPAEIEIVEAYTSQLRIGNPLQAMFEILVTQGGIKISARRRISSEPITIVHASATNYTPSSE